MIGDGFTTIFFYFLADRIDCKLFKFLFFSPTSQKRGIALTFIALERNDSLLSQDLPTQRDEKGRARNYLLFEATAIRLNRNGQLAYRR